jgi:phosphatidylglycerol lysyltransferase
MGFVVSLEMQVFPEHHIYLVAEREGALVGVLSAVPIFRLKGWFVEDLLRHGQAPNGTTELMVSAFLELVREMGATYVTLGLEPLAGPIPSALRLARRLSQPLFHFQGLEHFKEKLHPSGRETRYLFGSSGMSRIRSLFDVLVAFSRIGLMRFAFFSLLRGPMPALRALTRLLVLWLALLTLVPTAPWFPSPVIHRVWCVFDLGLVIGLLSLCRRYQSRLALGLAIMVSVDTVLTLIEAISYNLPRLTGPMEAIVTLIACTGPFLGATILWGSWCREERRRLRAIRAMH